ncbi:MAG TPA: undecaprenyldiphospho-muramoylpentapeptide beta-N-acetylglucosaminyltransferase [Devosiaceae bacterium]|nr:undecaprenyldiphospho-muramoylpentapeptide beta-N-acetylglucosaminyltransferase [Devosiaceae bacterium]
MSTIVLMAGGTGGHLFPAMALAQELRRRGHVIHLMTDERVSGYGDNFLAEQTHVVPSATPSIRNPVKLAAAALKILWGISVAWQQLGGIRADAAIAFGGYPTVPSFLAARLRGIPGAVHDSNAVLGRANHLLARFADKLALCFEHTARSEEFAEKVVITGNPVRDRAREAAKVPYPMLGPNDAIRVLVFGGSQGARAFGQLVPAAIALLPPQLRSRLALVQQVRAEDMDQVTDAYRLAKINVDLAPFFSDLPERMAQSHLVISRSGGGTVAELCVIGRPAILIPLPGAIDADQKNNALVLDQAGGGWIAEQASLTPQALAERLNALLSAPQSLAKAAAVAKSLGRPDAVALLADLAEKLAAGRKPHNV